MMVSYPTNELPLEDLLRFAAENRLTAAIDLRSDLTAGRIDIVGGDVVDALFGGLTGEEAVYAAICSDSLRVNRGRHPKANTVNQLRRSTQELVEEGLERRRRVLSSNVRTKVPEPPTPLPSERRRKPFRLLGLSLFGFGAVALALSIAINHRQLDLPERGLDTTPPRPVANVEPIVGAHGLDNAVPTSLRVNVLVDSSGEVIGAKFEDSRAELTVYEDAAFASLRRTRFVPGRLNGHNTVGWTIVTVPVVRLAKSDERPSQLAQLSQRNWRP